MRPEGGWRSVVGTCVFLAAIIWLVFAPTLRHGFVNFDDGQYVYDNPLVRQGVTLDGVVAAFTRVTCANWHPITLISHMLDCQLYGLNPGRHHLTNVLLHAATAIMLFLVLRQMTGYLWRSAFVAALFAIHPLRVESVAWVAERKDVLSGLFFMLTLWFYTRYASGATGGWSRRPGTDRQRHSLSLHRPFYVSPYYWAASLCFAFGLLSKPMLVTLPVVVLLLDYWPLGRMAGDHCEPCAHPGAVALTGNNRAPWLHLLAEKLPWFALSAVSSVVTIFAQHAELVSPERFPLSLRIGNAVTSGVAYLGQLLWPSGLAVLYPFPAEGVGITALLASAALLVALTVAALILRRRHPYLWVGWLWNLVMLLPVIGILQVGWQARADRYTYLPQIGLGLALTWTVASIGAGGRWRRAVLTCGGVAVLAAFAFCARRQVAYWRDSTALWGRVLACTSDNFIGHYNYGVTLQENGQVEEACAEYRKAAEINAAYEKAYYNLGNILVQRGTMDEAIAAFQKAVQAKPEFVEARNNLGLTLAKSGRLDLAIAQYQKALEIQPDPDVYKNLGAALLLQGRMDEAMIQYDRALGIAPDDAEARYRLGKILQQRNRAAEAISQYRRALQIRADFPPVLNNLAWILAANADPQLRDGVQAVQYAGRACELTQYQEPIPVSTLAAAYAEAGRFDDAVVAAQNACALAQAAHNQELVNRNRDMLSLYRAHRAYREAAR